MPTFLQTVETVEPGLGFPLFGKIHLIWLTAFVLITVFSCLWYRRLSPHGRKRWRCWIAALLLADEAF